MSLSITRRTKKPLPRLRFEYMKNKILGPEYDLSLVFAGDRLMKKLNISYRKRKYIPNVLSFPIDKKAGEIFINPNVAAREAKKFGMSYRNFIGYLFIHGVLHLKGLRHGSKMEELEQSLLKHITFS